MAGRDGANEHLWYHGTRDNWADQNPQFQPPDKVLGGGANGSDMGEGTYFTRDRSWAEEHAFGGYGIEPPHDEYEQQEWLAAAKVGRVLSVQFQPRNPAKFQYGKGVPPEYEQAEAARKAGHDAIVGDNVAVSFEPHRNARIIKVNRFQDLDWMGRSPSQAAREALDDGW